MRFIQYEDLAPGKAFADKVAKIAAAIERDDFKSPDVKKLNAGPYYRAKLDEDSRLLLQFVQFEGAAACLALEVIAHHQYTKSRFLRGAAVDEAKLPAAAAPLAGDHTQLRYLHPKRPEFLFLDKPLSLDDAQDAALRLRPPLIFVGSAGSGKTALLLAKLRRTPGRVAYVTESRWLAEHARSLYVAFDGAPERQEADFLSYQQLLESVQVPPGRAVQFRDFTKFFAKHSQALQFTDAHAVFEEFRGVLTAEPEGTFDRHQYLQLGVKQSLFGVEQRAALFTVFERYGPWLEQEQLYEPNLVACKLLPQVQPQYEFVAIDEVQDLTNVQLAVVLESLKPGGKFILAGDANQIVHPNYFGWAKVKSLFWRGMGEATDKQVHVFNISYRNSVAVTAAANAVLRLKHLRFGSIDKETNNLMQSVGGQLGSVFSLAAQSLAVRDLDLRSQQSTQVAVIVLRDEHKAQAHKVFKTPLVFSIHECKGLEYETVVLFRLIGAENELFAAISAGVTVADLQGDELAFRRAKDKSDKSLEIYKFFVNALYVALTRAVRDVVVVDDDLNHPLLKLLGVVAAQSAGHIRAVKSSAEDWQREQQRLAAQGKAEQAAAIGRDILKQKPVPWPVFDREGLPAHLARAFDVKVVSAKAREQVLEFACFHHDEPLIRKLHANLGVGIAPSSKRGITRAGQYGSFFDVFQRIPQIDYGDSKRYDGEVTRKAQAAQLRAFGKPDREILRDTEQYGLNHRTQLGLTPLMHAAAAGNVKLVEALVHRGADLTVRDHVGRQALHWLLRAYFGLMLPDLTKLGELYELVAPAAFDVLHDGRVYQIGREMGEYFPFQFMVALYPELMWSRTRVHDTVRAELVEAEDIQALPPAVLRDARKTRTYLSSVLARAEVLSKYTPSRKLWYRENIGDYMLNVELELRVPVPGKEPAWQKLREILNVAWLFGHLPPRAAKVEQQRWQGYLQGVEFRKQREEWRAKAAAKKGPK